jgi:hypothetical protein
MRSILLTASPSPSFVTLSKTTASPLISNWRTVPFRPVHWYPLYLIAAHPEPSQPTWRYISPLPHSMHQSMRQSMTQHLPQSIPPELPQPLPQSMPQHLPQTLTQHLPQTMTQHLPQTLRQTLTQTLPQSMTQHLPQHLPQSMPRTLPQSMPQTLTQTLPQHLPQTLTQSMPQSLPQTARIRLLFRDIAGRFPAYPTGAPHQVRNFVRSCAGYAPPLLVMSLQYMLWTLTRICQPPCMRLRLKRPRKWLCRSRTPERRSNARTHEGHVCT